MTVRGVDFFQNWLLKNWLDVNAPHHPKAVRAQKPGEQLLIDAAAVGLTLDDLEIETARGEKYIFDAMVNRTEPETPGD